MAQGGRTVLSSPQRGESLWGADWTHSHRDLTLPADMDLDSVLHPEQTWSEKGSWETDKLLPTCFPAHLPLQSFHVLIWNFHFTKVRKQKCEGQNLLPRTFQISFRLVGKTGCLGSVRKASSGWTRETQHPHEFLGWEVGALASQLSPEGCLTRGLG